MPGNALVYWRSTSESDDLTHILWLIYSGCSTGRKCSWTWSRPRRITPTYGNRIISSSNCLSCWPVPHYWLDSFIVQTRCNFTQSPSAGKNRYRCSLVDKGWSFQHFAQLKNNKFRVSVIQAEWLWEQKIIKSKFLSNLEILLNMINPMLFWNKDGNCYTQTRWDICFSFLFMVHKLWISL